LLSCVCVYGGAFRPIGCRKQLLGVCPFYQRVDKPDRQVDKPASERTGR
jgi:hypothetical protein